MFFLKRSLLFVILAIAVISSVYAQDVPYNNYGDALVPNEFSDKTAYHDYDVMSRQKPEYAAKGARVGSFIAYPSIDLEFVYDDNIRAATRNEAADIGIKVRPELLLRSDFNNHQIDLKASADMLRYFDETDDNTENINLSADTRIDVASDFTVNVGVRYGDLNASRTANLITAATLEPIGYTMFDGYFDLTKRFNRFSLTGGIEAMRVDYDDGINATTLTVLDQDQRDVNKVQLNLRADYEVSPGYKFFTRGSYAIRKYFSDNSSNSRDNDAYRGTVGVAAALTNQIVGEAEMGYTKRSYDNFDNETAAVWLAAINWYPTPLLTARLSLDRDFIDGVDGSGLGVSGILQTNYTALVNYEILRSTIITPSITYIDAQYRGSLSSEETYVLGARLDHYINNNLSAFAKYEYSDRQATIGLLNFDRNIATVGLKVKL